MSTSAASADNGANNTNMPARAGLARVLTNGEMVYQDDFKPKNILLTGGAGFIGSHVAILLAQKYPEYKVRIRNLVSCRDQLPICCTHLMSHEGWSSRHMRCH